MRYGLLTWVVLVATIAFAVRCVAVLALGRRWPVVADLVDRWWPWVPVVVVLVAITIAVPIVGVVLTVGLIVAVTRAGATGSPFRPRR